MTQATLTSTPSSTAPSAPGAASSSVAEWTPAQVRQALLAGQEIALLDVREEDPFAQSHPLFAANLPLGRIELDAWRRIPRRDTAIVVYDNGEGLAPRALNKLRELGYTQLALLQGGLQGWREAGGELFIDVNVPSKSFGELVEAKRHTPSLSAQEVKALLDAQADVVVLDMRRFDEYQTMSIHTGISVPGAEVVLRAANLAPNPATQIIVNCAGRTRSIIGTQSLVNAGLPNPIAALRNGTIGWTLAGQTLDHGASRRFGPVSEAERLQAAERARRVADGAGVKRATLADVDRFVAEAARTTYLLDVRTPEEYAHAHLPGFANAPGGQLVQETDHTVPVRGARIVLVDDDGARANMSASWLAQMNWDVWVLDLAADAQQLPAAAANAFRETGVPAATLPPVPAGVRRVSPQALAQWLGIEGADVQANDTVVLNLTTSANHVKAHIPGAWFVLRPQLAEALPRLPVAKRYVLTCGNSSLAAYAVAELQQLTSAEVLLLDGGNAAWQAAGLPTESGEHNLASPRIDRYRRPYEGTDAPREAMQAYLDWEYGLVEQLGRDGTHGFRVLGEATA
ncbi:sulfurtransferase [Comamonas serinivorans]|uniref:Sulfurtransferase n=1 Tax=Comamonas serinivorans TaxID=1082851 RepID=A0A1Y0EQV6_9BURK|nr:rhodanese-related sulfurtransferase [Comamonas serinivorans]ARU05983.1 sulfurtransferase [Comamonas serinivorans]